MSLPETPLVRVKFTMNELALTLGRLEVEYASCQTFKTASSCVQGVVGMIYEFIVGEAGAYEDSIVHLRSAPEV